MSVEEKFLGAVYDEDDDDEGEGSYLIWRRKQREKMRRKNEATIGGFLGKSPKTTAVGIMPSYYGALLSWAVRRHIERDGWKVVDTLGYRDPEPFYIDVSTDYDKHENLLMRGQLLVEKDGTRFVVTIEVHPRCDGSVQVQGLEEHREAGESFVNGVMTIAREENFYRGKRIEFAGRIRFLNVKERSWDSIVLDSATKKEIRANTIQFLRNREHWSQYGIPQKRGVLLAGEPGTGKTLICKALMAEAEGITCITTHAYDLCEDEYITELYELADDLAPCIVFIEDIDLIGLNREEYHYQHGPALLALLNVLDGVEERHAIVTVATTNSLEALDKALSHRPSRFDRVIKLSLPSLGERKRLVELLCQRIPVNERIQDYIASKAENCTPVQLQEIVYSLAIEHAGEGAQNGSTYLELSKDDVDHAIAKVNGRNKRRLGFEIENNRGDGRAVYIQPPEETGC